MFSGDVIVCLLTSLVIRVGADCLSEVLSCVVSLESKLLAGLLLGVLCSIWLNVCVTCFNVSSLISS